MPVGPSHRGGSRSSPSSSRSGGSHSSSRSYSSSRSSSSSSRSYSSSSYHSYDYSGGAYIEISPRGWAKFGITMGFILTIVLAIIGVLKLYNNIPYHILMRKDAREYMEIIDKANNGDAGYYIKHIYDIKCTSSSTNGDEPTEYGLESEGLDDSTWRDDTYIDAYSEVRKNGINYYWLEISFYSEEFDERIKGITYSYYSQAAVTGLSYLNIVYTRSYDGDGSWDIIQQEYDLSKNIDYWYAGNQILWGVILIILAGGVGTLMVWCSIKLHNHGKPKKEKETKETKVETITIEDKFKECEYCGAQMRLDDTSCMVCGARRFKKIKKTDK